jgi:hypothetical protein
MIRDSAPTTPAQGPAIVVVELWLDEVKKLVPVNP